MNARPLINFENVSKVYSNGTVALQEMSLTANAGEFISLVGASGCGKSTVLRLAAELIKPSSGQVTWTEDKWREKLAFVFQEPALMPWATLLENVRLPLKLAGIPGRKSRNTVQEALHRVGLNGFEKSYPRQLSGGMKMRASLARALVTQPEVMLMDEPFGALDEMTRSKLNRDLLQLWQQQQWTVLFVTHNLYEAVFLSKRVVVMAANPGRFVTEITIDAPYPRTEEFRTSRLYNDYCREVFACLQETASPALA
ncbi:MAG: ABC transporter ATP-binding protein [Jaaginema sp. PMC 1079.18]|nr:ABC transporter ATP-binding protein [Jaaginema sp. PMC 1080.18]MEC4850366.1 ABC transporter ATP-binding protein [Jaaginema sp. PMC 1079.18]MEC4864986.1 ABC transporter ATP-binding protein [Jaaginema sp. PMC 1078.18]